MVGRVGGQVVGWLGSEALHQNCLSKQVPPKTINILQGDFFVLKLDHLDYNSSAPPPPPQPKQYKTMVQESDSSVKDTTSSLITQDNPTYAHTPRQIVCGKHTHTCVH